MYIWEVMLRKLHIWEKAACKNTLGKLKLEKSPLGKYIVIPVSSIYLIAVSNIPARLRKYSSVVGWDILVSSIYLIAVSNIPARLSGYSSVVGWDIPVSSIYLIAVSNIPARLCGYSSVAGWDSSVSRRSSKYLIISP